MELMRLRTQASRDGASRTYRRMLLRRTVCLLTAVGLLPALFLGPFGPGTVVIHDHDEEDFHAHKIDAGSGGRGAVGNGHDHSAVTAIQPEGVRVVLTLPDLPRLSTYVHASGLQVRHVPPLVVVTSIVPQHAVLSAFDLGARDRPVAPPRAQDAIVGLLLGSHALLI